MPLYHKSNSQINNTNLQRLPINQLSSGRWEKGRIEVGNNWYRLGMDTTHYSGNGFLTLTNCGPTCFLVWCQLACQDALAIVQELKSVFFECGAPAEIQTDNVPAFCRQTFLALTDKWAYECDTGVLMSQKVTASRSSITTLSREYLRGHVAR